MIQKEYVLSQVFPFGETRKEPQYFWPCGAFGFGGLVPCKLKM